MTFLDLNLISIIAELAVRFRVSVACVPPKRQDFLRQFVSTPRFLEAEEEGAGQWEAGKERTFSSQREFQNPQYLLYIILINYLLRSYLVRSFGGSGIERFLER